MNDYIPFDAEKHIANNKLSIWCDEYGLNWLRNLKRQFSPLTKCIIVRKDEVIPMYALFMDGGGDE